jgi:hypothetical protein
MNAAKPFLRLRTGCVARASFHHRSLVAAASYEGTIVSKQLAKFTLIFLLFTISPAFSQEPAGKSVDPSAKPIESGSRVYVSPIEGGFDTFLTAAIIKKKVPITVVTDKSRADYEISGIAESEKAGWAKMLFMSSDQSRELASVKVVELKTGDIVYGYAVHKGNSYRGKQSAAEACAKHLKEKIESYVKKPAEPSK